jgi:NAD(P)-dependent dehydrogenase (short-subunit alcohol dehydrogenase family)
MDTVTKFTQPLPRRGQSEDVANTVVYLASDRSAQVTGILIPIDGGTTAGPPASQVKLMFAAAAAQGESEHK